MDKMPDTADLFPSSLEIFNNPLCRFDLERPKKRLSFAMGRTLRSAIYSTGTKRRIEPGHHLGVPLGWAVVRPRLYARTG